ncbi:MAG: CocE/NonD family hydrolase, partial [Promethearchaeota archaeon]
FGIPKNGIKRYPEYMLKLKDGTKLATDIYIPRKIYKKKGKAPTIIVRLPYWKDSLCIIGYAFAAYGYVVVMQDTRGCAHSEGFNFFLQTERDDGLELLKWISKQYWYNGKIGMLGGSYFGMTQLTVSYDNNLLTCVAPAICSISNIWKHNGGLKIHALTTSIYRIMLNIVIHRDAPIIDILTKEIKELYLNPQYALYNEPLVKKGKYLKFSNFVDKGIDECTNILADFYKIPKFDISKRNYRIYFKFLKDFLQLEKDIDNMPGLLNFNYSKFSQPGFFLAGWQDMFIEHIIRDFKKLKEDANGEAKKYSKLVIGPWAHADKGHPEGSMIEFLKGFLNKGWYDYWLQGKKKAVLDLNKPSIKYYIHETLYTFKRESK